MKHYQGYIDHISNGAVSGWIWDTSNPERQFFVDVTDDKGRTIRTRACAPRKDLIDQNIGTGCYGFSVCFTRDFNGPKQDLSAYQAKIANTDYELKNLARPTTAGMFKRTTHKGLGLGKKTLTALSAMISSTANVALAPEACPQAEGGPSASAAAVYGRIVSVNGGQIEVLIADSPQGGMPLVFIGGKPAWKAPDGVPVKDGHTSLTRYYFYTSGIAVGQEISLWVVAGDQVELCETRHASEACFERSILIQLARAADIARDPVAVAITCWDGAHNPVGRAKVLFDALSGNRPAVLFCFIFKEFGGDIWPPLATTNENIVTIPWSERFFYLKAAQDMGIKFNTVWMCKPRAPTFQMAVNIAHPDAKIILDMDDNEEHFSRSEASRTKAYGLPSIGLSRALMEKVKARTAASVSLVRDFDAVMVRHARQDSRHVTPISAPGQNGMIKVGFIGTVRPHKQILEAARAISHLNKTSSTQFEFHAYGDVQPQTLHEELEANGVVVKRNIPANQLAAYLRGMNIILSGYPSGTQSDIPITKYQISSKIGDALSVGRPVLVPNGPSVSDLTSTPGVFLFTKDTFAAQLQAAAAHTDTLLDKSFTMEAAYEGFQKAEQIAAKSKRCSDALALIPTMVPRNELSDTAKPTLLVIWKQHDGNLYGRRMDMICRTYRKAYSDHRVVALEVLYPDLLHRYHDETGDLSESAHIRALNIRKTLGNLTSSDGVEYRQLVLQKSDEFNTVMQSFLLSNRILPTNSVIVLFPNIMHLDRLHDLLHPYPLITDVVDNQLAWASGNNRQSVLSQYFTLMTISDRVVFNSTPNRDYFLTNGFLELKDSKTSVIPNWYVLPDGATDPVPPQKQAQARKNGFDLFYSGNMNDRIDWELMTQIAKLGDGLRLHLIGEAGRSQEQLARLLDEPNVIFHGVLSEQMVLQLLRQADLTVMPHVVDKVSSYMNPLKVHMYAALGLQTISSNTPGIEPSDYLTICPNPEVFLDTIKLAMKNRAKGPDRKPRKKDSTSISKDAHAYMELIAPLMAAGPG